MDTLNAVVNRVVTFLSQISDADNMTLAQVEPVASEMQRLGKSLEKELDNLYVITAQSDGRWNILRP